jgi:DegV family protein with EDD domain
VSAGAVGAGEGGVELRVRIATDSACDLPEDLVAAHRVAVVPLYITVGPRSYLDGAELTRERFYALLPGSAGAPGTAAPGPSGFRRVYEQLAAEGASDVISIHLGAALSATVDVARLAASEVPVPRVHVVDSGQVSLGIGLLVLAAAKLAEEGASVRDILVALERMAERTYAFAAADTVEYLRRGGRVSLVQAGIASALQIKPILKMHRGVVSLERVRTRGRAIERVVELATARQPWQQLAVVHAHAPQQAVALQQLLATRQPGNAVRLMADVTPVIGAHVGPGAVGLVCVGAPDGKPTVG